MKNKFLKNSPFSKREQPTNTGRSLADLQRNIDRLFDNFMSMDFPSLRDLPLFSSNEKPNNINFAPPVEIDETDNQYMVSVDVPGLAKSDFNIEIRDNTLIISGERKEEREEKETGRHFSERIYGAFFRSFPLPANVDQDQIQAEYREGVLEVLLPKTEATKARTISVGEGAKAKPDANTNAAKTENRDDTSDRRERRPDKNVHH